MQARLSYVVELVALGLSYAFAAWWGMQLSASLNDITLLWPPTGLAIAWLLVRGVDRWPGVALGIFTTHFIAGMPAPFLLATLVSNTAEAWFGAYVLTYVLPIRRTLERARDVVRLLAVGAVAAPMISATGGILGMIVSGVLAPADAVVPWFAWCFANAMGVLILTPLLLTLSERPRWPGADRRAEAVLLALFLLTTNVVLFTNLVITSAVAYPLAFLSFPAIIWAAVRMGPRGAAAASAFVALGAILGTVAGTGPFAQGALGENLTFMWIFIATEAGTALALAALLAERLSARRALDDSETRHQMVLEEAADGVFTARMDGTILDANTACCRMLDYEHDALVGMRLHDLVPQVDQQADPVSFAAIERGEQVLRERRLRDASGRLIHVEISARRLPNGTALAIMRDVSSRKAFERALIEARDQAEEMSRLKSSFLANMSHEIRTPLTAILGFAEILAEEVPESHREAARLIETSGRRLLETLNSVLDLSVIESGGIELVPAQFDLAALVTEHVALYRTMAEARGLALRVEAPEAPLPVWLDRTATERVLANLVSNALKFTEAGEVEVSVGLDDDGIYLIVRDTGVGIAPEFVPRLFEAFKQESSGLARSHEGVGLGLAITHQLVELMEGQILVESQKDVGSTFTVRIPAYVAQRAA